MRGEYIVRWNNAGRYSDFIVKVEYENVAEARAKVWEKIREKGVADKVVSVNKVYEGV